MEKKNLAILGSTGSIGRQTLDIVRQHPDLFEVELLTANNNSELLIEQAIEFDVNEVVICNPDKYAEVADALQSRGIKVFVGMDSICDLIGSDYVDVVVAAMVGFSGLKPTIAALEKGKTIALANKETLVVAGSLITDLIVKQQQSGLASKAQILPIDSEHSAIFQCLQGNFHNKYNKIHLTASGGPFRTWEKAEIAKATAEQALKHPNWNMGAKITIDSATMMNKGLEVIEAKWLFNCPLEDINIVVHPESIIHSMVEFEDGAIMAQMGIPDMRQAIQYALCYPERKALEVKKLDLTEIGKLTFFTVDIEKFPALSLAFEAVKRGGNTTCLLNAANEVAVAAFLQGKISFYQITDIVEKVMNGASFIKNPNLDEIYASNIEATNLAKNLI